MATVRVDSLGTTLTRGVFLNRHDTVTRQAFLSNEGEVAIFDNTVGDYSRAVNAYIAEVGLFYPLVFNIGEGPPKDQPIGPVNLPLLKIRAQRYGPAKMLVTALYQRTPGTDQPDVPFGEPSFRTTEESFTVYRTGDTFELGFPSGSFIDPDVPDDVTNQSRAKPPTESRQWAVSVTEAIVTFQLPGQPPLAQLEAFRNTANDGLIEGWNFSFAVNTIYFAGYDIDPIGDGGHIIQLLFKITAAKWLDQHVVETTPAPADFTGWRTDIVKRYELSDFSFFPL